MEQNGTYICPHCGNPLRQDQPYCGYCGAQNELLQRRIRIERALGNDVSSLSPAVAAGPDLSATVPAADTASPVAGEEARQPAAVLPKSKRLLRRLLIAGVCVVLACLILATALIVRQNILGYHASPDMLAVGVLRAVEEQDEALLYSLFHTDEQVSGLSLEGITHMELVDILEGTRGKLAILYFRQEMDGNQIGGTLSAYQRDGRWYLSVDGTWFLNGNYYSTSVYGNYYSASVY